MLPGPLSFLNVNNPFLILILLVWELVWKGYALWKSAKNNQRNWFIAIFILNTFGILPIVYLRFFQKKTK